LREASTSEVKTVQWRRGWGGFGVGLAAGAIFGAPLAAPYYRSGYYGYGYGYPAYSYAYSYHAYSYGYSYPAYSYAYAPAYSYAYAYPRYRYRAAGWRW
jgi:hypothetical protein